MRIAVTGASGRVGRVAVARLRDEGHTVLGLDLDGPPGPGFTRCDLTDYGQTVDALLGVTARHDGLDAVVHLAAVPVNGLVPDVTTFVTNLTASFHVLHAATRVGITRVTLASSINAMGFPFAEAPPRLPVDENYSAANNTYGLAKVLEETTACQLARWHPQLSITALRFTNVVEEGGYGGFVRAGDPAYRRDLLWTYVDARDCAQAIALSLHRPPGFAVYNVTAADSGLSIPTRRLAADTFPGIEIDTGLGEFESPVSIAKARAELGYTPAHSWRTELPAEPAG